METQFIMKSVKENMYEYKQQVKRLTPLLLEIYSSVSIPAFTLMRADVSCTVVNDTVIIYRARLIASPYVKCYTISGVHFLTSA